FTANRLARRSAASRHAYVCLTDALALNRETEEARPRARRRRCDRRRRRGNCGRLRNHAVQQPHVSPSWADVGPIFGQKCAGCHCFLLEPHLAQDAYVTSAVIKPQQPTIVHHVILFEAAGQNAVDARRLNDASGGNGWTCFGGPGLSETHPTSDSAANDRLGAPPWISAWVPGHATNDTPAGTGVLV